MKIIFPSLATTGAVLLLVLPGCGKKPDAGVDIDKAEQALAKAAPPPPATTAPAATQTAAPASQMHEALTAYKSGDLEDAVTRFQKLRAQKNVSPDQRMAINSALAAVMGDIYLRASKGDARAQQAVKEYERLQNSQQ